MPLHKRRVRLVSHYNKSHITVKMSTKTTSKQMQQALADDLERVASSADSIELRVYILNGDDFALSLPRDAPVSELRARVAQAMEAKNPERVRLFHADGEAELTQGNNARGWVPSCGGSALPCFGSMHMIIALVHGWRQ